MPIQFDNVKMKYNKTLKWALNNFSFTLHEHDFCALIGNNGCGKTTSINLMCNILPLNSGSIRMFGNVLTPDEVSYRNKIGFMLSEPSFIKELSIVDYLQFVCKFQNVPRQVITSRIKDIVSLFGLYDSLHDKIEELSKGNQVKVSLCSALIHNPTLLILDEPFVHLDVSTTQLIIDVLKTFKGSKTLLISSHSIDLIIDLCDRFLIMDEGKLLLDFRKEKEFPKDTLKNKIKNALSQENLVVKKLDWLR
ncbi:MAG TPA: ABC transporter ATP-binding protein [Tenuifilaceae bacterium]|nr:ABC transporter ATP-binding protein [Tenuifilaceae bacterium]